MPRKKDITALAVDAALDLAAELGWSSVSMWTVARRAGIPLADLRKRFRSPQDILTAYFEQVDLAVLKVEPDKLADESPRDRLFDVMMRRFDALAPRKEALRAVALAAPRDPALIICGGARLIRSMHWMLEAAGLSAWGLDGALKARGLAAIYLATLRVWLGDDSAEMSKTMAFLDRRLGQADAILRRARRTAGRRADTAEAPA